MTPVQVTPADEACFGVTGNNMVIFGVTISVTNHDLYSIAVNAAPTDTPITISATLSTNFRWRSGGITV